LNVVALCIDLLIVDDLNIDLMNVDDLCIDLLKVDDLNKNIVISRFSTGWFETSELKTSDH
jgi:hypothetical protein